MEADTYPAYIANLRSVGCPEATINDIVTADLAAQNNGLAPKELVQQFLLAARAEDAQLPSTGSRADVAPGVNLGESRQVHVAEPGTSNLGQANAVAAPSQSNIVAAGSAVVPVEATQPAEPSAQSVSAASKRQPRNFHYKTLTPEELTFLVQHGAQAFAARRDAAARKALNAEHQEAK